MATAAERATGPADDDDAGWADLFQEPEGFRPATPPPTARRLPRVRTARPLEPTELDAFELRLVGHHSLWVRAPRSAVPVGVSNPAHPPAVIVQLAALSASPPGPLPVERRRDPRAPL